MIINKEQIDIIDNNNQPAKKLIISYVNKDHGISFFQYIVPKEEMFKWVYSKASTADPPFYVHDMYGNPVMDPKTNQPKIAQWKSYDNKPVRRQSVNELPDMRINEILNFFGEAVKPMYEMNIPTTWFCDIETDVNEEIGFPTPEEAACPINTIAITHYPKTILFTRKDLDDEECKWIQNSLREYSHLTKDYIFEKRYYPSETEMINAFLDFITPIPALTGWNFLGYDWLYIYNRCKNLNIPIDRVSPTGGRTNFKLNRKVKINVPLPLHKVIYDYLIVYQSWDMSVAIKENNTLDFVSEKVLGIKKVVHQWGFSEFYRDHFKEYAFYNLVDTILVEQIDKKLKTADIWYMLASELKIELNSAFSTIQPAETVMCNFIYPNFKVIPEKKNANTDGSDDYVGAFVWPTQAGIYKFIGGLDFASLYPTIMRQFQISPETFVMKDKNHICKPNEIKTCSGAVYRKDPNAIIPAILTVYYAKRKAAKTDKKNVDREREELKNILEERLKKAIAV